MDPHADGHTGTGNNSDGIDLTLLLVIDPISLAFDYNDGRLWLRGARGKAA